MSLIKSSNFYFQFCTILAAALIGGSWWCTVRSSGEGSGPSMGLIFGLYWLLLMMWILPEFRIPKKSTYILLVFVIGFGLAGMQGYGQFNQWMQGFFYFDRSANLYTPISPLYGVYHLFICGLTWGGWPALLLSWILLHRTSEKLWIQRIIIAVAAYVLMQWLISLFPHLFLPLYSRGYYQDLAFCPDCQRTLNTAANTYGYLGMVVLLTLHSAWVERKSLYVILPIALGFALSFSFGGLLHRVDVHVENPWWKMWEYTCGFGGGMALFSTFWLLKKRGILQNYIAKIPDSPPAWQLWLGFWIPLYFAIGELSRDRLHQVAKVWNILYGFDARDLFAMLALFAVVIVWGLLCLHLIRFLRHREDADILRFRHPFKIFLIVYNGFYALILLYWIRFPLSFENNVISILTLLSMTGVNILLVRLNSVLADSNIT
jgi:hypothetical protein